MNRVKGVNKIKGVDEENIEIRVKGVNRVNMVNKVIEQM